MKPSRLVLILFSLKLINCLNLKLINDFLQQKRLKFSLILSCDGFNENVKLLKSIKDTLDVYELIVDISNESMPINYDDIFYHNIHPIGVIIDLSCDNITEILCECSRKFFFHQNYHWLMIAMSVVHAQKLLYNQNINVDAEISVAIPNGIMFVF